MYNNFMSKPIILENQILLLNNCKNASQTNKKIKFLIKSKEIKTEKNITILKNIFYNLKKKEKLIKGSKNINKLDLQNLTKLAPRSLKVKHSFEFNSDIESLLSKGLIYNFIGIKNINSGINYFYIKIKGRINSRRTAARTKHYETRVISKIKRARIYSNECFHNINSINFKDESFTKINLKNGLIGIRFFYHNILFITYSLTEY